MKKNTALTVGIIVMLVTAAVYLISCQSIFSEPMCWLALALVLVSEAWATLSFHTAKGDPIRVARAYAVVAQTLVTMIASVIFINVFLFEYSSFVLVYILSAAAALVISVLLGSFAGKRTEENTQFRSAKQAMFTSRAVVQSMLGSDCEAELRKALENLDENLRFSDDSVVHEMDAQIYSRICALQEGLRQGGFDAQAAIAGINDLIRQRNFLVKASK